MNVAAQRMSKALNVERLVIFSPYAVVIKAAKVINLNVDSMVKNECDESESEYSSYAFYESESEDEYCFCLK